MGKILKKFPTDEIAKVEYHKSKNIFKITENKIGEHRLYLVIENGFELLKKANSPLTLYEYANNFSKKEK